MRKMVSVKRVLKLLSLLMCSVTLVIIFQHPPTWRENRSRWSYCPSSTRDLKIVSVVSGGRLGNMIWEYLSVWAIALRYGFYPVVPQEILLTLNKTFRDLNIPAIEDVITRCKMPWLIQELMTATPNRPLKEVLDPILKNKTGNVVFLLRKYEVSRVELRGLLPQIRTELLFKKELEIQVRSKLRDARLQVMARLQLAGGDLNTLGPDYVGIHVRRTDYIRHLKLRKPDMIPAGPDFFFGAMQVMRALLAEDKRGRPVFVVVSDDLAWCRQELEPLSPDLIVSGSGDLSSPSEDLALLSSCNHTIFAYGTFGLTAATLAGGYTIMYTGKQKDGGMKILPPNHTLDY